MLDFFENVRRGRGRWATGWKMICPTGQILCLRRVVRQWKWSLGSTQYSGHIFEKESVSHNRMFRVIAHNSRTAQTYFSNFFQRLICAATFFGDGAPVPVRAARARRTSNTLPAAGPYFLAASLGRETCVFSASAQSAPTA